MQRKLLFLLFAEDTCRQRHAFMYALDLNKKGYDTKIVLEGAATKCLSELSNTDSTFAKLFAEAKKRNMLAGICSTAAQGCGVPGRAVLDIAKDEGLTALADLDGHAGIEPFVRDGYEIVVF